MTAAATTAGAEAALRAERAELLALCRGLGPAEWRAPSGAPGWQVRDVVAHLGATCRDAFGPRLAGLITGGDIERANDEAVRRRRHRTPAELLEEYATWSGRFAAVFGPVGRSPLGAARLRLAELGWYPMRLLCSVMVFDHHLHLRHDIAPAVGAEPPPTDAERMSAVLEWMMTGLQKMNRDAMGFADRPLALTLRGPGGGSWRIDPAGGGRLRVRPGGAAGGAASITGSAEDFPVWATGRRPWREHDLAVTGDEAYAARFLDAINIV